MSDWTYQHFRKQKKSILQVQYYRFILEYVPIGRKNRLIYPSTLSQYKNEIEWLKDERPSDIINFGCLLPKLDFRIFYFELETLPNKFVKLYSCFFYKNNLEQKYRVFYFHQKSQSTF